MQNFNYWLWLVKTDKGEFFIGASGNWTEAEAAQKVLQQFKLMNINVNGMVPRKRIPAGNDDAGGTIVQQLEPKDERGYDFMAGRNLWAACGRLVEYDAERILFDKQMGEEMNECRKNKYR